MGAGYNSNMILNVLIICSGQGGPHGDSQQSPKEADPTWVPATIAT